MTEPEQPRNRVPILVTGAAGFIGYHLCSKLLERGDRVIGVDNMSTYYDTRLKQDRLAQLVGRSGFEFHQIDISDAGAVDRLFAGQKPEIVVNLAAQAGVRYSLQNPFAYVNSNLHGFMAILESCRHHHVRHLVFASSSSVYGANTSMPFSVHDNVDHPVSLYAATKKANELMAHSYSHLFRLPVTGLRFFTVYGPWGRPDMALFLFTRAILRGEPIPVFNQGKMRRDFTYIDDIVDGVMRVMDKAPSGNSAWNGADPDPGSSLAPYRIYNIGHNEPVELMRFIEVLEQRLGKKARRNMMELQPGDVPATFADIDGLVEDFGFRPDTTIETGIDKFVTWYLDYYANRES